MAPTQTSTRQESATAVAQNPTSQSPGTQRDATQGYDYQTKDKNSSNDVPEWRRGAAPVRPGHEPKSKQKQKQAQPRKTLCNTTSKQEQRQANIKKDGSRFQSTNPFDALMEEEDASSD